MSEPGLEEGVDGRLSFRRFACLPLDESVPTHYAELRDEGRTIAEQWLTDWRALGEVFATYPNDARYSESS